MDSLAAHEPGSELSRGSILDQFNFLDRTGALDDLSSLRKENRELDMLIDDAATLFAEKDVDSMINFVISRLLDRFIPTHLVFIIEPPRGGGISQYVYRNLRPSSATFPVAYWEILKKRFADSASPVSFDDLAAGLGSESFGPDFLIFEPDLLIPMHGIGGLYGLVILGRKLVGGGYAEGERKYLERMTRFLSIGIQNSLHHIDSITDSKTGLYNHSHFLRRLEEEIARTARQHDKVGVIMLDIDHFKTFNDTWGHLAGDAVLVAIARTLGHTVRTEDVAARFGGEEFSILAIGCDAASLMILAERIRLAIEGLKVSYKSLCLSVTASLGCAMIETPRPCPGSDFIDEADQALYISKSSGRNRSTLYRPSLLWRAGMLRTT